MAHGNPTMLSSHITELDGTMGGLFFVRHMQEQYPMPQGVQLHGRLDNASVVANYREERSEEWDESHSRRKETIERLFVCSSKHYSPRSSDYMYVVSLMSQTKGVFSCMHNRLSSL